MFHDGSTPMRGESLCFNGYHQTIGGGKEQSWISLTLATFSFLGSSKVIVP